MCVHVSSSVMSDSGTSWTAAHQSPLSIQLSRQEHQCGQQPLPSVGDLPDPGIKPGSPSLQTDSLSSEPPGKPICNLTGIFKFLIISLSDYKCYLFAYFTSSSSSPTSHNTWSSICSCHNFQNMSHLRLLSFSHMHSLLLKCSFSLGQIPPLWTLF